MRRDVAFALVAAVLLHAPIDHAQPRNTALGHGLRWIHESVTLGGAARSVDAVRIDLCDASVTLRATAPGEGGRTVDDWARRVGAAVAINGDYFAGATHLPLGPARGDGRWWTLPRTEHRDAVLAATRDGAMVVVDTPDRARDDRWTDAATRVDARFTEVVGVREHLLVDGRYAPSPHIREARARHPRTAVGISRDGRTAWFVVVGGRTERGDGATTRELADVLLRLGAWQGLKLDGGGSSTLFVAGHGVVNHPSDGAPRVVANHLGVIVSATPGPTRCGASGTAAR